MVVGLCIPVVPNIQKLLSLKHTQLFMKPLGQSRITPLHLQQITGGKQCIDTTATALIISKVTVSVETCESDSIHYCVSQEITFCLSIPTGVH